MGAGEYGGNGSVHWTNNNKKDRNNGGGANPRTYHQVDEQPSAAEGGHFVIQVLNVQTANTRWEPSTGTLSVRVPIVHGSSYTKQVIVTWPPDDIAWPPPGQQLEAS